MSKLSEHISFWIKWYLPITVPRWLEVTFWIVIVIASIYTLKGA